MTMFIIQSALLLAIAFILGCILGCLLRRWFGAVEPAAMPARSAPSAAPRIVAPAAALVSARPDDLTLIEGIGPVNNRKLKAMGVTTFAQIASWSAREQAEIGSKLEFPGRIEREDWVVQARELMAGHDRKPKGRSGSSKAKSAAKTKTASKPVTPAKSKSAAKAKPASLLARVDTLGGKGGRPLGFKTARGGGKGDNLTLINGVGNVIEKKLNALGIWHFDQIAAWSVAEQQWIGKETGFPGRPQRENWVGESKVLAAGGTTEHARQVEMGAIPTSRKSRPNEK